jgi:chromosome partitioning protein
MAQVISGVQEKGGSGKSTMLCAIAAFMAADGARVVIIDTDPQQTASQWAQKDLANVDVVEVGFDEQLSAAIRQLSHNYDVIFVDTAGFKSTMAVHAIMRSNLVLIPSKASEPDARGAMKTLAHIKAIAESADKTIQSAVVLVDVDKASSITNAILEAFKSSGVEPLRSKLWHRTGFKEMHSTGRGAEGSAAAVVSELIGELQINKMLDFYNYNKEAANG